MVSLLHFGPSKEGMAHFKPFIDLGPFMQNVRPLQWNKVSDEWAMGMEKQLSTFGSCYDVHTGHIKTFDLPTFDSHFEALKELWEKYPSTRKSLFVIEDWATKASQEIPDDETAYPWREINCHL